MTPPASEITSSAVSTARVYRQRQSSPGRPGARRGEIAWHAQARIDHLGELDELLAVHLAALVLGQAAAPACFLGGAGGHGEHKLLGRLLQLVAEQVLQG